MKIGLITDSVSHLPFEQALDLAELLGQVERLLEREMADGVRDQSDLHIGLTSWWSKHVVNPRVAHVASPRLLGVGTADARKLSNAPAHPRRSRDGGRDFHVRFVSSSRTRVNNLTGHSYILSDAQPCSDGQSTISKIAAADVTALSPLPS